MKKQISRRGFLRGGFFKPEQSNSKAPERPEQKISAMPLLRPPTALDEQAFLDACDGCGACVTACPYDSLLVSSADQTPYFDFARSPCHMCEDMPCVTACPTDALDVSRDKRIGKAYLRVMNCLASMETFCSVCVERCPVEGAISLERGKPKISSALCVGCGECVYRCPAPASALIVLPH